MSCACDSLTRGAGSSRCSRKLKPAVGSALIVSLCSSRERSSENELHADVGERVIVVACGGVSRPGQLRELGGGHLVQEVRNCLLAHHVGELSANQQDRDGQLHRCLL